MKTLKKITKAILLLLIGLILSTNLQAKEKDDHKKHIIKINKIEFSRIFEEMEPVLIHIFENIESLNDVDETFIENWITDIIEPEPEPEIEDWMFDTLDTTNIEETPTIEPWMLSDKHYSK